MDEDYKEVRFDKYCASCKYKNLDEKCDPCNECLESGMNIGSSKPVNWEAKNE